MGDRANVKVFDDYDPGVYLYTHWGGFNLASTVRKALTRGQDRWNDQPYLARIIFCEMVGSDVQGSTGFGIGSKVGDGDDRIIAVDVGNQVISIERLDMKMSFRDFIGEPGEAFIKAWQGSEEDED